jgi:6-phosphofructokinase 2
VRELSTFAGQILPGEPEIVAAARELLDRGPNEAVVVSLGAAGALLVRPDAPAVRVHGPRVHALSTVGAGDSLVGAMAVALERGADMEAAVCWGVAAGTAATLAHGTGLCRRDDVERMLPHVSVHALAVA